MGCIRVQRDHSITSRNFSTLATAAQVRTAIWEHWPEEEPAWWIRAARIQTMIDNAYGHPNVIRYHKWFSSTPLLTLWRATQHVSRILGSLPRHWENLAGEARNDPRDPKFRAARRKALHTSKPYDGVERIRHKSKRWNL